eukprot:jgi/Galph1/4282/GphlegSOOS_G2903.1
MDAFESDESDIELVAVHQSLPPTNKNTLATIRSLYPDNSTNRTIVFDSRNSAAMMANSQRHSISSLSVGSVSSSSSLYTPKTPKETTEITTQERPMVLLLVGLPGSGKSTFAEQLEAKGWVRICQDELKSRYVCEEYLRNNLVHNSRIVIDRCNVTREQRAIWINYAKASNAIIGCVVFAIPLQDCLLRVAQREEHPTLKGSNQQTESIILNFAKEFCAPIPEEGIHFCRRLTNRNDEQQIFEQLTH